MGRFRWKRHPEVRSVSGPTRLRRAGDSAPYHRECPGVFGGEVIGVGIGGDDGRLGLVEVLEVGDDAAEGFEGLVGFQIADVLAEEDLGTDGEGDRVFQVRANSENRFAAGRWPMAKRRRELDRERGVATGAAQDQFAPHHHAHDGVVHVADDGAVVDEEEVGYAAKAFDALRAHRCKWVRR